MRRFLALALLFLVGACDVPHAPTPVPEARRQAVTGGVFEPGSPAVVAIVPTSPVCGEAPGDAPVLCTGTLIAPRRVLTAGHCVQDPAAARVFSVVFAAETARALPSERVRTHVAYPATDWRAGANDIGVIHLVEDAPVEPARLPGQVLGPEVVGRTVRVVGFGGDDEGRTGVRRSGTARITAWEQDGSFRIAAAPGMSCGGDSGGPVFLEVDGVERLVGITSHGDPACTTGVNTRVDVQERFISSALMRAEPPPPQPPEWMDLCELRCLYQEDCPLGMACVSRADGERQCAVAGLEAGHFGDTCDGAASGPLCVKTGESCRQWLPCPEPEEGGCAAAGGGPLGMLGVLLVLGRASRSPRGRKERPLSRPPAPI